jgi:hypothetical protein
MYPSKFVFNESKSLFPSSTSMDLVGTYSVIGSYSRSEKASFLHLFDGEMKGEEGGRGGGNDLLYSK